MVEIKSEDLKSSKYKRSEFIFCMLLSLEHQNSCNTDRSDGTKLISTIEERLISTRLNSTRLDVRTVERFLLDVRVQLRMFRWLFGR
jgi:hypothetical protein